MDTTESIEQTNFSHELKQSFSIEAILGNCHKIDCNKLELNNLNSTNLCEKSIKLNINYESFKQTQNLFNLKNKSTIKLNKKSLINLPIKSRSPRVPFTRVQINSLENKFKQTHYLSGFEVICLAKQLNLTETRVKIWFQNRRARERRDNLDIITENLHSNQLTNLNTTSSTINQLIKKNNLFNKTNISQTITTSNNLFIPISHCGKMMENNDPNNPSIQFMYPNLLHMNCDFSNNFKQISTHDNNHDNNDDNNNNNNNNNNNIINNNKQAIMNSTSEIQNKLSSQTNNIYLVNADSNLNSPDHWSHDQIYYLKS